MRNMRTMAVVWMVASVISLAEAQEKASPHYVPADKHLSAEWMTSLTESGTQKIYRDAELEMLGMPCGGIAAGQLYLRGDGTLAWWWIANNAYNTGYGAENTSCFNTALGEYSVCYKPARPAGYIDQGFAIAVKSGEGPAVVKTLSRDDFDNIGFIGEYPIAKVLYETKDKPALPVTIEAAVFSPFIPLNAKDSAIPATIFVYTVKNTSQQPVEISLAGWLQNPVCLDLLGKTVGDSSNRAEISSQSKSVVFELVESKTQTRIERTVEMYDDFESGYGKWTIHGEAFGKAPAAGTLDKQNPVSGFNGKGLVNTYLGGSDQLTGKMISKPFEIKQEYICFLIGGGSFAKKTCMNLLIDGQIVHSARGRNNEHLDPGFWNVKSYLGKTAFLEIVDDATEGWGHINVDDIYFTNLPPNIQTEFPKDHPYFGNVALTAMDGKNWAVADIASAAKLRELLAAGKVEGPAETRYPLGEKRLGAVGTTVKLDTGETKRISFVLSWYFPNRRQDNRGYDVMGPIQPIGNPVGNMYANFFKSALDVANYIRDNAQRLIGDTALFHQTYYKRTTLPYWLNQRLMMPTANLATETCQWWKSGRFWAWEGVGCCNGTCNHVWNYEHTMARLFPELERSVRHWQDFGDGFNPKDGAIGHRGKGTGVAFDGQAGSIMKAYREHLSSANDEFLKQHYPNIKQALEFLIRADGNDDGIIEGEQANTYDIAFWGPNTFVGSLYLGALKAGEQMAIRMNDSDFAAKCRKIAESGGKYSAEKLFDGEYFFQDVDLAKHPKDQYGKGCLADQLFGQNWAHQLDLGYIYPQDKVRSALAAVWKYDWAPDVGPQNKAYPADRPYANPGEPGLFICTWPKSKHLHKDGVLYRNEVWTGIEYQVAANMIYDGLITEGLSVIRAVHMRYDGAKHNPWNEVECGDHYARSMSAWGCVLALQGYLYDGPQELIGFAPNYKPDNFESFFTAAEGWGNLTQKRSGNTQQSKIEVRWGHVPVKTFVAGLPQGKTLKSAKMMVDGQVVEAQTKQTGMRVSFALSTPADLTAGKNIEANIEWN